MKDFERLGLSWLEEKVKSTPWEKMQKRESQGTCRNKIKMGSLSRDLCRMITSKPMFLDRFHSSSRLNKHHLVFFSGSPATKSRFVKKKKRKPPFLAISGFISDSRRICSKIYAAVK
jgi:hypothetical protein